MIGVVTDSASNLPSELAGEFAIEIVPMYLMLGEASFRDGVDLAPQDLYERLTTQAVVASSSSPSPADFLVGFERTGAREIVCVTVAAGMSAAHQAAVLAGEQFDGRVEVVDSMSASMAEGFVALEAARCVRSGGSLDQAAGRANEVASRARVCAAVATFEFLRRSGRVNALQAYAATMLDIKPVFAFAGGEVAPLGRPRTRRRAVARVLEHTLEEIDGRPVHLAAIHAAAEDDARDLLATVSERADVVESLITPVTPVIGAHTGPGLVGTAFFCD